MRQKLTANGFVIDQRPGTFGTLRNSTPQFGAAAKLRRRLEEDGYLFLHNVINTDLLSEIRALFLEELRRKKYVKRTPDPDEELTAVPGGKVYAMFPELNRHDSVRRILEQDNLLQLISDLFEEQAKALNMVWVRAVGPGRGELPHCDWVYMSKGSPRVLTAWVPVVDVPIYRGPLMILEGSHRANPYTEQYLTMDADNLGILDALRFKHGWYVRGRRYSRRPDKVQREFGTRWLSANFVPGDVLLFGPRCLHATLDNRTTAFRLSVDVRFQPAAHAVDPRYDGPEPAGLYARNHSIPAYVDRLKRLYTDRRRLFRI